MREANEIVKHLFGASSDKLSKSRFFLKAVEFMPKNIADELLFCYKKDLTLYFVAKNPAMVFELNYKLKSLKEVLQMLSELQEYSDFRGFRDIKVFATKYEATESHMQIPRVSYLENERSSGLFEIKTENSEFEKIFIQIRDMIRTRLG